MSTTSTEMVETLVRSDDAERLDRAIRNLGANLARDRGPEARREHQRRLITATGGDLPFLRRDGALVALCRRERQAELVALIEQFNLGSVVREHGDG